MEYKEYFIESKKPVNLKNLEAGHITNEQYISAHQNTIILCADVMVWYKGGFLLVKRDNVPALGELWPIGGRMQRGVPMKENVSRKVKAECNLDLENLILLGVARTSFNTDPFNHKKGTDTLNLMYYAEGKGELKLDELHSKPLIVDEQKFMKLKDSLHPYIRDFMEIAFREKTLKNKFIKS